jgi:radical SAM superfamily enzyme YgiQ (UPF0313 family)
MTPVCLVIPPSGFLLDERVFMSLGILRVAAVLEARGVPVEVLDLSGIDNYEDVVDLHSSHSPATHYGITATTPQLPAAVRIARRVKAAVPGVTVMLGGPHVTLVNAATKRERRDGRTDRAHAAMATLRREFDILVAGDGEEAIFAALTPGSPSLVDADDPASPLFLTNAALTALPYPARHLVDVGSYHYAIDGRPALSLIAQLGCPFECGFCGGRASPSLRRVRTRTVASIVDEMVQLYQRHGTTGFMFYDDELNVNRELGTLMRAIGDAQARLGVHWRLRGFVKAQLFSAEQAAAMHLAGFRWILVGFESGAPRILDNINKRSTLDENTRCLEIATRYGLKVKALMSIGHPGESAETVQATRDWLIETAPADFDVTLITTYPGTPYYDEAVAHQRLPGVWTYTHRRTGDRLHAHEVDHTSVAEFYKGCPDGGYRAFGFTDFLSGEALVEARDTIERDVRAALGIPYNPAAPSLRFEHSMGQSGMLPASILKRAGTGLSLSSAT